MSDLGICWEREQLNSRQYRHIQHLRPICYRDGSTLRRIVSDWGDSGITARPHIVTASQLYTSVAVDGLRRIHPTRELERYIQIGAPLIKSGVESSKVAFASAARASNALNWQMDSARMRVIHAGHYVKTEIELLKGWVPDDGVLAFPLTLSGLTLKDGAVSYDGKIVARLRAPYVYDADAPGMILPIKWEIGDFAKQTCIIYRLPDLGKMSRPVVDPTLVLDEGEAGADKDTAIESDNPTTNNGSQNYMYAERSSGTRKCLLEFAIESTIPAGSTIDDADLGLYVYNVDTPGTILLRNILSGNAGWTEAGATWNTIDGSNAWAGSAGCSTAGTDYSNTALGSYAVTGTGAISITLATAQVEAWLSGNYGFVIYPQNQATWNVQRFRTSEASTASERPALTVVYTAGGGGKPMYAYAQQ